LAKGLAWSAQGTPDAAALAELRRRLMSDRSLQFDFHAVKPPEPWRLPLWLERLGGGLAHVIGAALPAVRVLFWIGLGLMLAGVLFLILREFAGVSWARRRRETARRSAPADWRPDPAKARALLENADRLAAQGRFDLAVRLILHRSIDDIETRRPRLVRPALTARDIAALPAVPAAARGAFARIAAVVEYSAFAGRPIGADAFAQCRAAYEAFAFPGAWA
jgi:hypothetical protein